MELLYINEISSENVHSYVTLVCDQDRRIIFICEGKNSEMMNRLAVRPEVYNGRRKNIGFVNCDFGEAYPSGVRRNISKARIVYDESHTVKLIVEAMDDTARRAVEIRAINARTRHLIRMNVSKLSEEQPRTLRCSIEDYCELAEDYCLKNMFSDIYKQYDKKSA